MNQTSLPRCAWALAGQLELEYHDREWGVPVHDDRLLFEFLILEGAQAGLSWSTILKKREGYRKAFDNFSAEKVARFSEEKIRELLENQEIIRNRLKITAAVKNARAFLSIRNQYGSFASYIWAFTGDRTINNSWQDAKSIPVSSPQSETMSRDLRKRGFKFVGPTICYAFMQAVGMVNDHTVDCFRHTEVTQLQGTYSTLPGRQFSNSKINHPAQHNE